MLLLPYENFFITSDLSKGEILERLKTLIYTENTFGIKFFNSSPNRSYTGEIDGSKFIIKRVIRNTNSFLPRISGKIERNKPGSDINIIMRLHNSVIIFMLLWCGFLGFGIIASNNTLGLNTETLIPLAMIGFMYVISMVGFKFESRKSKKDLIKLFEGKSVKKKSPETRGRYRK